MRTEHSRMGAASGLPSCKRKDRAALFARLLAPLPVEVKLGLAALGAGLHLVGKRRLPALLRVRVGYAVGRIDDFLAVVRALGVGFLAPLLELLLKVLALAARADHRVVGLEGKVAVFAEEFHRGTPQFQYYRQKQAYKFCCPAGRRVLVWQEKRKKGKKEKVRHYASFRRRRPG